MKKIITTLAVATMIVACKKAEAVQPNARIATPEKSMDSTKVKFTLHSERTPYQFYRRVKGKRDFVTTTINTKDTVIIDEYDKTNDPYKNIITMNTWGRKGDSLSITGEYMGKKSTATTKNDGIYFTWIAQENYK